KRNSGDTGASNRVHRLFPPLLSEARVVRWSGPSPMTGQRHRRRRTEPKPSPRSLAGVAGGGENVAVESRSRGPDHDLALVVDPICLGFRGSGRVERGEDAVAVEKPMRFAIGAEVVARDLPGVVDPHGVGVICPGHIEGREHAVAVEITVIAAL